MNGMYNKVIIMLVMYKFSKNVFVGDVCMYWMVDMIIIMMLLVGMVK